MKFFFVVTGIGLGHATRIISVIDELLKRDKNTKILIAGYESSYKYFKDKKFKVIKINGINYTSNNFNVNLFSILRNNLKFPLTFRSDINSMNNKIKEFNPDFVVVDWEPAGLIAANKAKKKSILIFNYNPYSFDKFILKFKLGRFKVLQSKVMENIYGLAEKTAEAIFIPGLNIDIKNKFYFVDFVIREKYNEIENEIKLMKKLNLKKRPILVMLGGSTFGFKLADKLINVLSNIDEDFLIFGYSKSFTKGNVKSFKFKDNYLEYLKVSKGIIMLAGHSSFGECAVFKKPCLVFPIRGHVEQMLNAYTIEEAGFGLVKYLKEINSETLKRHVEEFLIKLDELQEKANKLNTNGDGSKQIVDFLLQK